MRIIIQAKIASFSWPLKQLTFALKLLIPEEFSETVKTCMNTEPKLPPPQPYITVLRSSDWPIPIWHTETCHIKQTQISKDKRNWINNDKKKLTNTCTFQPVHFTWHKVTWSLLQPMCMSINSLGRHMLCEPCRWQGWRGGGWGVFGLINTKMRVVLHTNSNQHEKHIWGNEVRRKLTIIFTMASCISLKLNSYATLHCNVLLAVFFAFKHLYF